ncbi:IOLG-like protein [Mya arenaria]|uniref:IOLG-like protein n=1 Tax=Mya arenaria TaxID=6604 RepID=A0ABY7EX24_MYAAR|nr:IOLG-like protein [Mya arenaria]
MEAGKHVLCEKPLAEGRDAVSRCYDVAEKRGLILMAAFNRRFDPSYRSLYTKVRAGEVGDIQFIRTTFRDTPLWLGAETFSQTFLSHDIDIVCWFAGGLPESVVCVGACHNSEVKENGDVDSCVVTMKFPGEIIGVIDFARYCSYGYDIRLEVFGTKGMLKMEPCLQTTVHEYSNAGKRDPPFAVSFPDRFKDAYLLELDHFIDAVEGGRMYLPINNGAVNR